MTDGSKPWLYNSLLPKIDVEPARGSKWPNSQVSALKFKSAQASFGIDSHGNSRTSGGGSNFFEESATRGNIAVIVDQSWSVITAKSTYGLARTNPRRLGHPARAGFFVGQGTKNLFVFPLSCSASIPSHSPSPVIKVFKKETWKSSSRHPWKVNPLRIDSEGSAPASLGYPL